MNADNKMKQSVTKQVLMKARRYCALAEHCQKDARQKILSWGVQPTMCEKIIAALISENLINEERYARMFAGGKFRIKKWGRNKICHKLREKNISEPCIKACLHEIEEKDYLNCLKELIVKKTHNKDGKKLQIQADAVARYAIGKGFEAEMGWEIIRNL